MSVNIHRFGCLAALLILATAARAQAEPPTPTPADPLAAVPVQVLDQRQVEIGSHRITFQRIAPPAFPAPASAAQTDSRPALAGAEEDAASPPAADNEQKPDKTIALSATVFDRQFTEVRWHGDDGAQLRAWVNIDFDHFSGVSQIETADAVYALFFGLGNDTSEALTQNGRPLPDLSKFPPGRSSYQVTAGNAADSAEGLAALDVLCAYYDAHKAQLAAACQQREANQAARERWLRDHPPVQPDTVIRYWPIKNSVHPDQQP